MTYVREMPYIRDLRTATSNGCSLCSCHRRLWHLVGACKSPRHGQELHCSTQQSQQIDLKAITKGASGNSVFIADLGTQDTMQAMEALDTRLPPWLAQETTNREMRLGREERDRTIDSVRQKTSSR